VETIDWDTLSDQLSVIDQDEYRSTISPFNWDEPENFWISKNIDFMQWESANDSRTLLLSALFAHGMTEVCSHFIDLAKASPTNGPVLYFFRSSVSKVRHSTCLTHTLLHQIVRCSIAGKANSIAAGFLSTLVNGHFRRRSSDFGEDDPWDMTLKKILDAPDDELIEALVEAINKAEIRELSIIVDGLWEGAADRFVQFTMDSKLKFKALLTCQPHSLQNLPDRILCIEYGKERKGLHIRHSKQICSLTG
jgi:hypothetical protein